MNTASKWKDFWRSQTTPLHRHQTPEWYSLYAQELNLLLRSLGYKSGPVLEAGCGSGSLFDSLEIDSKGYRGVDFSESLLQIFRQKHPELDLVCADASKYCDARSYALILNSGVMQYFDRSMLKEYMDNCTRMLGRGGILLMANIPQRRLRLPFHTASIDGRCAPSMARSLRMQFHLWFHGDPIGNWYSPEDFLPFAGGLGEMRVFGSLFYPYRFSVGFVKI